jgi:hypothetical protein
MKLNPYYLNTLVFAASIGWLAGDIRGMVIGIAVISGLSTVFSWSDP